MLDMSGWWKVWLPTMWPSSAMRRTMSGADSTMWPTTKKAAGASCFFSASRMASVWPFSYPQSKVR